MVTAADKAKLNRDNLQGKLEVVEQQLTDHETTPLDEPTVDSLIPIAEDFLPELEINHQIISHSQPTDFADHLKIYKDLTLRMIKAKSKLVLIKKSFPPTVTPTPSSVHTAVSLRLPNIELPTFTGKYEDWPSFADLFVATVDRNPSLSAAQKLQYLKSYLKGDAETLVKSFTITDNHYSEAWTILSERYNNKREIVHSLCKRLLFQPVVKGESANQIQTLLNVTNECLRSLQSQGVNIDFWDDLLVVTVIEKLDSSTRAEWAKHLKGTGLPIFKELQEFLEQHIRSLLARGMTGSRNISTARNQTTAHHVSTHSSTSSYSSCIVCNQQHPLYKCEKFIRMGVNERKHHAIKASLCFNCLRPHKFGDCNSKSTCKKCNETHHTLLHKDKNQPSHSGGPTAAPPPNLSGEAPASSSTSNKHTTLCSHIRNQPTQVLLKTALVNVKDVYGHFHPLRVLFDDCSESSFITDRCVSALGISRQPSNVEVKGLSGAPIMKVNSKVVVQLYSIVHEANAPVEAYVLHKVSGILPNFHCDPSKWTHLEDIQLADPNFHTPGDVDMLIGADIVAAVMREGLRRGPRLSPLAQNTLFGWVLSGKVAISDSEVVHVHHTTTVEDILQRFWALEEVPEIKHLTEEEQECETHFASTHRRQDDGRFIVHLPFNHRVSELGDSKSLALQRLHQLERRFNRNPHHKQQYVDFMREYSSLGHMRPVTEADNVGKAVYLPHHFVTKEDSTTTKLRVVFDASAKTSSGCSLNETLLVGPTVQSDLFTLLLKFRYHQVALKGDITKMYRQFLVNEDDANYQRILWRESTDQPVGEFKLLTVTYGTASAPYLATKCLQQLATDEGKDLPEAASIIQNDMYVDDMLSGANSTQQGIQLYHDVSTIISRGGMEIRKWATNDPEVLKHIPVEHRETDISLNIDTDNTIKALGVRWNPANDSFSFSVNCATTEHITKRELLSQLAKVFDPLGWLTPVTVSAKIIFQQLWKEQCGWDDQITGALHDQWNTYQQQLVELSNINIPRCVVRPDAEDVELHGFSDASERAYAAVVYLKCTSADGTSNIQLLAARSKVAPLNPQCIHRLELCGALLLAELIETVGKTLPFQYKLYAWSDSMITIKWLSSHPSRWKTFVANRVAKILEVVPAENWHHVRGVHNPADPASRGITPAELVTCDVWWTGPPWLKSDTYPIPKTDIDMNIVLKEQRAKPVFTAATQVTVNHDLISRYSSFSTLRRVVAYCLRFVYNCANRSNKKVGQLTTDELNAATTALVKIVQAEAFKDEIRDIKTAESVGHNSKIKQLRPILDRDGVLRVGGRLHNMKASESTRHPIILPSHHELTTLLIRDCHLKQLHSGLTLTLSTLQQQYWVMRGRDVVRLFVRKCVTCRKIRATTSQQLMGNLPPARVNPSRPFQHTGVDFAGPFQIRVARGRGFRRQKCYFCIFVCFATKAVHLDVVMDMTSESFIATLTNFTSRRGVPSDMYSDCGTNFVGAEKELRQLYTNLNDDLITREFAEQGVRWHFNTPASPHQGGLWEAGVKAVKFHLRRVVGSQTMTLQQFTTLLCKIEACLNSRPLCAMSSDPMDMTALTPGHFLIGTSLTALPEQDTTKISTNRLGHWQQVQQLSQRFWKRWSAEYVTSLQQRFKWVSKRANLQINDLVVIKDELLPPTRWKMGRIIDCHMGNDGCVRTVTIQTATGKISRSIVKLSPILYHNEQ